MSSIPMNMLTAHDAIAQGSSPAVFFSIARVNEDKGNREVAVAARLVAHEIARMTGVDVGGRRLRSTPSAKSAKPRNDNRRERSKPRREWQDAA